MNYWEKLKLDLQKKNPLYIKAKVIPKSPKNEIVEIMEDGKANAELTKFLKKSLGLSEVVIVSGQKDRVKLVKLQI